MTGHDVALILGALGTIVAAWLAARGAARSAVEVAQVNREVQQEVNEVDGFKAVTEGLRTDLAETRRELAELKADVRERDRRDEADRAARIAHAGWDYTTANIVHEHAAMCPDPAARLILAGIGAPPPMYAHPGTTTTERN